MEKNQYKLCIEIFRRLEKSGVLKNMILVGSWCMPFYKDYFSDVVYSPSIRTRDIDFLIPRPGAIKSAVDVIGLVKDLGFVRGFRGREGYMVLEHPELAVEFLVPEKGRGTDKPVQLPTLGLNAQALRFLELLSHETIHVKVEDVSLILPHPANYAVHKLIVSKRRKQKDKSAKDFEAGLKILKALISQKESRRIKKVFDSVPSKWKKIILNELENAGEDHLLELLR